MVFIEDLGVGQTVDTMGRQIAIPDRYKYYDSNRHDYLESPNICIRLQSKGGSHGEPRFWTISTSYSGLICFLPNKYADCGILSVRITQVNNKSVVAEPVEYLECIDEDKLSIFDFGQNLDDFSSLIEDGKIIHHNKKEATNGTKI